MAEHMLFLKKKLLGDRVGRAGMVGLDVIV